MYQTVAHFFLSVKNGACIDLVPHDSEAVLLSVGEIQRLCLLVLISYVQMWWHSCRDFDTENL